jgi:DNA polymerase III alpha subunit
MCALFSAEAGNTEKIVEAVEESRRMKIILLPPDINESDTGFKIEMNPESADGRAIRFGLSAIKNVGQVAIDLIIEARKAGPFTSFTDFCLRVDSQKVNKKVLESLIKAGAMDKFGHRAQMLAALDKIRELGTSISKMKNSGQSSLFGDEEADIDHTDALPDVPEFEKAQSLAMEKELLGFYLTEHPHAEKLSQLGEMVTHRIADLLNEDMTGRRVTIGGIIEACRNVVTKANNQQMCFCRITDLGKSVDVVVFPKTYATTAGIWQIDNLVLLSGKVESRATGTTNDQGEEEHEVTILVDSAAEFKGMDTVLPPPPPAPTYGRSYGPNSSASPSSAPAPAPVRRIVSIDVPSGTPSAKLIALNSLLASNKGDNPANLVFYSDSSSKTLPLPYGLNWTDNLKSEIDNLLKR